MKLEDTPTKVPPETPEYKEGAAAFAAGKEYYSHSYPLGSKKAYDFEDGWIIAKITKDLAAQGKS